MLYMNFMFFFGIFNFELDFKIKKNISVNFKILRTFRDSTKFSEYALDMTHRRFFSVSFVIHDRKILQN